MILAVQARVPRPEYFLKLSKCVVVCLIRSIFLTKNKLINVSFANHFLAITSYIPAQCCGSIIFYILKKNQDLKILGFFAKLYPRVLGLVATLNVKVIFIILIITLNLG